jgi:hypothetical protein
MELTSTVNEQRVRTRFNPGPFISPLILLAAILVGHWGLYFLYRWWEPQKGPSFSQTLHASFVGVLAVSVSELMTAFVLVAGQRLPTPVRVILIYASFALYFFM